MPDPLACPWCSAARCRPTRVAAGATEYRCRECGMRHTRKPGEADPFAFFPPDVDRAVSADVEPLGIGGPLFGNTS